MKKRKKGARTRPEMPRQLRQRRGQWSRVVTAVAFIALGFALVEVQITTFEKFALIAKQNRLRPLVVRAPRGTVYDRHGQVVAENRVGYKVQLMPAPKDSIVASLNRLRPVLGLSDEDIGRALRRYEREPHLPLEVKRNLPPAAAARFMEQRYRFPSVVVHEYPKRHYPAGRAVGHVMGYVAEITEAQLEQPEFERYRQGRWIGQAGLERYYEKQLGGTPGFRYLEVDATGRIKRWMPEELGVPPIPGRDLQLHLDLDLQRYAGRLFNQLERDLGIGRLEAAFVAVDPKTGGILALNSTPGFDPNAFVGGVDAEMWKSLTQDPGKPMLARATGAAQPPGSTFKLATAAMALNLGVITPQEYMPVACTGGMRYQRRYARCWGTHGAQNLISGIKNSCDVYFYQVGIRIGLDRFLRTGTRLGLAEPVGVDLPTEQASVFPENTNWWQKTFNYKPAENEIMSLVIGQGAVTLTPLKLAQLFVGLSRPDGKAPPLRLAMTEDTPEPVLDYDLTPEQIEVLRKGMRRVLAPGGTAHLSRLEHWDFMGKTGTAENPLGPDHGWFVGVGGPPGGNPEIVAAMLVMHGLHGSDVSGAVANAVNFYLNRKHDRPFQRYPTPRERLPRGMDIDWRWLRSPVEDFPLSRDTTAGSTP